MKPFQTFFLISYAALFSALLGVSFSYCWKLWKIRQLEVNFQLENCKLNRWTARSDIHPTPIVPEAEPLSEPAQ